MKPLSSELPFARADTRERQATLAHARILATSKTYGWDGLYAEVGENDGWHVENMVPVGHYIAISRDTQDFVFDSQAADGSWSKVCMPPHSLWIQPAFQPFGFHVETTARWCGVIVQPAKLKALIGSDSAVEPVVGLRDPVLEPVMQAISAEVLRGGGSGTRFAEAMLAVIGTQLLRLFGQAQVTPKGGLTGRHVRVVGDRVDAYLEHAIAVADLAALVGLSEAHFSRAFKQTTGLSPHQFVMQRRLERAKRLIADSLDPLAQVAVACGFADQSHLTRAFTKAFGTSPTALRKTYFSR